MATADYNQLISSTQQVVMGAQSDDHILEVLELGFLENRPVTFTNQVCAQLRALDYEFLVYTVKKPVDDMHLNETKGFYFSWEKCCFNSLLFNLDDPGNSSMILYSETPPLIRSGQKINYTSPELGDWKATYACLNYNKKIVLPFDDDDLLELTLTEGYKGNTTNVLRPRPYDKQEWAAGYSLSDPSPGPVPLRPYSSDVLEMEGNSSGLFSFTVAVAEKKNNVQTGVTHFVFQMPLTACSYPDAPTANVTFDDLTSSPKTICQDPIPALTSITGDYSFQWKLNDVPIAGETTPFLNISKAGIYSLEISDKNNCTRESNSNVLVVDGGVLEEKIVSEKDRICAGETVVLRSKENAIVDWYKDNAFISRGKEITISTSGIYRILSPSVNCTKELDTKSIDVYTFPSQSYSVIPASNELCLLSPIGLHYPDLNYLEYTWFKDLSQITGETFNQINITAPGSYYLSVYDPLEGCIIDMPDFQVVDGLCDQEPDFVLPNAFSPNDDGLNDVLEFKHVSGEFADAQVRVYNRWRDMVFEAKIDDFKWDGEKHPQGVYVLEILNKNETRLINVTLLR